ncbi:DUF115 domain-containing protein [Pelotomaculum isophthalicicum JI]|uniref:DUF115 domain-containing protein n=1 Tax=Pelotomaculum isophthalicicum JI TaxID=947010 RepID=A0A9X4H2T7_9FIRM|nr:6-hydroxymethylpterin diphosphokinase MptE-like protein [Pelotomaculum isophthalicicum]MDF9409141.1 DUF115 domain-containing protein [Pelotomaculum isophthalicicum JI]
MAKKKTKKKSGVPFQPGRGAPAVLDKQKIILFSDSFHTTTHFYRDNMRALKEHYPELARRVEQCAFTPRYRVVPSLRPDGTPNLYCTEKDLLYYDNTDPLKDAKLQLKTLKLKNAKLAVCLGIGLGYEVLYFSTDIADSVNTKEIIIIEKDLEIFKLACCYTDLASIIANPRVFLLIGASENDLFIPLKKNLAKGGFIYLRALKSVYHPSSLHLNKLYYITVLKTIREVSSQTVLGFGNSPEDSLIGIENMLANLSVIIRNPGINRLFGAFKDKPAIVVATGPSLNKNKHLLKGLENRALIISVDASLKILLDMGVKPHMVTALERVIDVQRFFKDIPTGELEEVYLAACPVIRKEVYDIYTGPKIIVYRSFDHFKWLGVDRGMLNIKASSGNMAFKIAAALGCNPIILLGQDLALSRDGETHARGHALGENQKAYHSDVLEVPGNDGMPIKTNTTFYGFLKGYEEDIAEYKGTCINATEGGAFIQGTQVMHFAEVIDRFLQNDLAPIEIIRRLLIPPDDGEIKEIVAQMFDRIDRTTAELARISGVCSETERMIREAEYFLKPKEGKLPQIERVREFVKTIMEQKKNCITDYETFQLFFMHVIQSFTLKFEMEIQALGDLYEDEAVELAENILRQTELFSTIGRLANTCHATLLKYRNILSFEFPGVENVT